MYRTFRIGKLLLISMLILIVFVLPNVAAENNDVQIPKISSSIENMIYPPDTIWPPPIVIEISNIKIQISQKDTLYSKVNIYNYDYIMGTITGGIASKTFEFPNGGSYKIEAIAEQGYVFDQFCDADNKCVTTNPITGNINSVGDYLTYIASFKPELPPSTIEIQALPASATKSKLNIYKNGVIIGYVTGGAKAQTFTFPNGGNYKIEPVAQDGYVFEKFCDYSTEECINTNVLKGYVDPTGDYLSFGGYFKLDPKPTPTPTPTPTPVLCDPSYPDFCIPPPPPDLNCPDIPQKGFKVLPPDPHGFDADNDGIGCESPTPTPTPTPTPVQGDILAYYRGLGKCVSTTETNDLLKGADDWRTSIVPPGFILSLTTPQLLALADEWRTSPADKCVYN